MTPTFDLGTDMPTDQDYPADVIYLVFGSERVAQTVESGRYSDLHTALYYDSLRDIYAETVVATGLDPLGSMS